MYDCVDSRYVLCTIVSIHSMSYVWLCRFTVCLLYDCVDSQYVLRTTVSIHNMSALSYVSTHFIGDFNFSCARHFQESKSGISASLLTAWSQPNIK
jgi:hypothetical protein